MKKKKGGDGVDLGSPATVMDQGWYSGAVLSDGSYLRAAIALCSNRTRFASRGAALPAKRSATTRLALCHAYSEHSDCGAVTVRRLL